MLPTLHSSRERLVLDLLLTNDDGIEAPGLAALQACFAASDVRLFVVAPHQQKSECGHSVTTRGPLVVHRVGENRWAVEGTPADCVRVALGYLKLPVVAAFSGVNEGGNLGAELHISGTVAAAREASLHGLPAVAISHYRHPDHPRDWEHVPDWLSPQLVALVTTRHIHGHFWNLNLPADVQTKPDFIEAPADHHPLPYQLRAIDGDLHAADGDAVNARVASSANPPSTRSSQLVRYAGNYQQRPRTPGSDIDVCFGGAISCTPVPALPQPPVAQPELP